MRRLLGMTAAAALLLAVASQPAWAQRPPPEHPVFGHMLYSGSGFIATPHAFIPPSTIFGTGSAIVPETSTGELSTQARLAGGISLAGWIEAGVSAYEFDAFAAFGKFQLVRQSGIFPAIAAGVLNLTNANIGRFGIQDDFYDSPEKATSFYAVASYVAGPGGRNFPSWVVISGGWGTGLFLEDNPQFEGNDRTGGVFGSVAFDFQAGEGAYVRFLGEWDGFDLNLGATAWLQGLEFTLGVASVDEGGAEEPLQPGEPFDPTRTEQGLFYNQAKFFASLTVDARVLGKLPWIFTKDEEPN